jgi:FemAB family
MVLERRVFGIDLEEYWFDPEAYLASKAPVVLLRTFERVTRYDAFVPEKTIHVDLSQTREALLSSFDSRAKHSITKMLRQARIERLESAADRTVFFRKYSQFAAENNLLVPDASEEKELDIFTALDPSGALLHAAAFMPIAKENIYRYRYSVHFAKSQANAALLWHAMLFAKEKGFVRFDLGGVPRSPKASKKLSSILFFKSQFGGRPVDGFLYVRSNVAALSALLRLCAPIIERSERLLAFVMPLVNHHARLHEVPRA